MNRFYSLAMATTCIWLCAPADAQTNVSGNISIDTTWGFSDSPFVLTADVTVLNGVSLTIEAGVEVQFPVENRDLQVEGTLVANGTTTRRIRFVGSNTDPLKHGGTVRLRTSSSGSLIENADFIKLADAASVFDGALRIETSSATVRDCTFDDFELFGIYVPTAVTPTVSNCTFTGAVGVAEDVRGHAMAFTNFSNNNALLHVIASTVVSAAATWPKHVYTLNGDVTVTSDPGATLTIAQGTEVQFSVENRDLQVEGTLNAVGIAEDPIRFVGSNSKRAQARWHRPTQERQHQLRRRARRVRHAGRRRVRLRRGASNREFIRDRAQLSV